MRGWGYIASSDGAAGFLRRLAFFGCSHVRLRHANAFPGARDLALMALLIFCS